MCVHASGYVYAMLCSVSSGLRSNVGTRSQSVSDFGLMQRARPWLVPDFGPMQFPNFVVYVLLYGMW